MKIGEVVLVKFPFSDLESSKKRPALVLSNAILTDKVAVLTIAMITSKIDGLKLPGDYKLNHWEKAGLLHPSVVRLSKIATIDSGLVMKSLGHLQSQDIKGIRQGFQKHFKSWI